MHAFSQEFECDAFFPNIDERFQPVHVSATSSHENIAYDFVVYEKAPVKDRVVALACLPPSALK